MTGLLDVAEDVWRLRDRVSVMDDPDADCVAAQLHATYNAMIRVEAGATTVE